ncbi:MAG: HEPN domain-containing protein [Spirochaetota bacterium]
MKVKDCFEQGLLKRVTKDADLIKNTYSMAIEDMAVAEESFKQGNYAWATIQAYTSMLNVARAILYSEGIRERSHLCVVQYLRENYSEELKDLVEKLDVLRRERHAALYSSRNSIDRSVAEERLIWGKEFLKRGEEILKRVK